MSFSLRRLMIGRSNRGHRTLRWTLVAVGLFATVFAAYATGVFAIAGGVVWIPGEAALVGIVAACLVGFDRAGLAFAWLVAFATLLGYHADHAFFGLSSRSFREQVAYFLTPEGLLVFGAEGVVLGTIAFAVGAVARRLLATLRTDPVTSR